MYAEKEPFEKEEGEPFFPYHNMDQAIVILLLIGVLLFLATFFPAPMEPPADPFETPAHIKPEWYFLAAYQFLKIAEELEFLGAWAPKLLGVALQGIIFALLLALPFVDRSPERNPARRPIVATLGVIGVISFAVLTYWGFIS